MTKTKRGADDLAKDIVNVREEVQKALEASDIIDVLVSKIKTILIVFSQYTIKRCKLQGQAIKLFLNLHE